MLYGKHIYTCWLKEVLFDQIYILESIMIYKNLSRVKKMGYHGLFMGCARKYWTDILVRLHKRYGNRNFKWSQVYTEFPDISKSDLTRLRSSSWITMVGKDKKTGMWRLTQSAENLCKSLESPMPLRAATIRSRKKTR